MMTHCKVASVCLSKMKCWILKDNTSTDNTDSALLLDQDLLGMSLAR